MGLIQIKFDNTLKQSDIVIPLNNSSKEEAGEAYVDNKPEVQQTHVYGIQAPLIMINNIVVDFSDVISFELTCDRLLPHVEIIVRDRYKLTTMVDTPGLDNELRVQILPKFSDKYKKINLTFYITNMSIQKEMISLSGTYKAPNITSHHIRSFGQISTYNFFQTIAQENGLGFATNVEDTQDLHYIYCPNMPIQRLLEDEVSRACTHQNIYDCWIDWWNNLIYADIKERYNAIDPDENIQIWVAGQQKEVNEGAECKPIQTVASFNNHPGMQHSELYVTDYRICNELGKQMKEGTDRIFSIYEDNNEEYKDHLIQDGDTKKDIFTKLEYLGEVYGAHNYLLANKIQATFKQKMRSNEVIEIDLRTPLLGVMRGNRVNLLWFVNDSKAEMMQGAIRDAGCINPIPETNIILDNETVEEQRDEDGGFVLDKSISGQYLVTKCIMKFDEGQWVYTITLARPTQSKPKLINEDVV